jgi:deoxycytidylate deaminase
MKEGYALVSSCNWAHAEIRALASVPPGAKPTKAVIYGHDFPCPYCEIALRAAGIKNIEINKDKYKGTVGLRNTNG